MLQLAWRWPILALAFGGAFFVFKHYRIGGIEHLHLEPRPQVDSGSYAYAPSGYDATAASALSSAISSGSAAEGGWKNKLTMAERFNLLQESYEPSSSTKLGGVGSPSTHALDWSAPIPAPPSFGTAAGLTGSAFGDNTLIPPGGAVWPPAGQQGATGVAGNPNSSLDAAGVTIPRLPVGNMTSAAAGATSTSLLGNRPAIKNAGKSIRVASFNTNSFGPAKMAKSHAMESLVKIARRYDVLALQGIQTSRDDVLPILIEKLNQSGRRYDYLIGPRVGRVSPKMQYAIVFDTERLETDRYQLYTVDDPEDLITYEPLVGWFRCKDVPASEAFTFSLINVMVDPNLADAEHKVLPLIAQAVLSDGRGEDDWIVAGDIRGNAASIGTLDPLQTRFAIRDIPTNLAGTHSLDSIFFSSQATAEYTGRSGAFDFLRKFNLSLESALEVSEHLPVWAEFSVVEGAEPGRVAPTDPADIF
ncbi:MAG: endonuclease/exonuclease/phosphatase family protein [Planctomycetota bacterium]